MKITVLLFGILKDIVGANSLEIQVENASNIDNLKAIFLEKYDNLNSFSNFSIAVNEEYVHLKSILKSGDIVAFIPPVSGG